jgi:hypothetical protein
LFPTNLVSLSFKQALYNTIMSSALNPGSNGDGNNINGANLTRSQSLSISPEVFEKLYLSPENAVKGDLRQTFGNPTPLFVSFPSPIKSTSILTFSSAIVGFVVALSPLSIELMGWRGAGGLSATV